MPILSNEELDISMDSKFNESSTLEGEHILFPLPELKQIIQMFNSVRIASNNIYDQCFLLSYTGNQSYALIYSSIYVKIGFNLESNSPNPDLLFKGSVLISISDILNVIKHFKSSVLLNFENDNVYIKYGTGRLFIKSVNKFDLDFFDLDTDEEERDSFSLRKEDLSNLETLNRLSRSFTSLSEGLIYFDKTGAYLNAGLVSGKVDGEFKSTAITNKIIDLLSKSSSLLSPEDEIIFSILEKSVVISSDLFLMVADYVQSKPPTIIKNYLSIPLKGIDFDYYLFCKIISLVISLTTYKQEISLLVGEDTLAIQVELLTGDKSIFFLTEKRDKFDIEVTVQAKTLNKLIPIIQDDYKIYIEPTSGFIYFYNSDVRIILESYVKN